MDRPARNADGRARGGATGRDPRPSRDLESPSESIILGAGNPHHAAPPQAEPRLNSVEFTMTVDKQDGRRFSGTFSSPRGNDKFVAAISRNNTILLVDDDGYTVGTILAPNRMEWCYMHRSQTTSMVSCTELTKQP